MEALLLIVAMFAVVCAYGVFVFCVTFLGKKPLDDLKDKIGTSWDWWH